MQSLTYTTIRPFATSLAVPHEKMWIKTQTLIATTKKNNKKPTKTRIVKICKSNFNIVASVRIFLHNPRCLSTTGWCSTRLSWCETEPEELNLTHLGQFNQFWNYPERWTSLKKKHSQANFLCSMPLMTSCGETTSLRWPHGRSNISMWGEEVSATWTLRCSTSTEPQL